MTALGHFLETTSKWQSDNRSKVVFLLRLLNKMGILLLADIDAIDNNNLNSLLNMFAKLLVVLLFCSVFPLAFIGYELAQVGLKLKNHSMFSSKLLCNC